MVMFDRLPHAETHAAAIADGFERYIIIYQGVDPDATASGVINAYAVVAAIREQEGDAPSWFGILDFEYPFMVRAQSGPSDPNWQTTVDTIVAVLDRVRAEFPGVQWSMYGMPNVPYWSPNGGYGWDTMGESEREQVLAQRLEAFDPILRACDWLNPSVYDRYELAQYTADRHAEITARETSWRHFTVELCNRFNASSGLPPKPTMVMVSPMFWKVGNIEYNMKRMPIEELLRDQVRPVLEAGAEGVAIWTGFTYYPRAATSSADLGQGQLDARYAFTLDYFGGVEPLDWTDPAVRAELEMLTSQMVHQRLGEVRADLESSSPENGNP